MNPCQDYQLGVTLVAFLDLQPLPINLSERSTEKQMERVELWLDEVLDKILIIADKCLN
jgi:hypothetical protein